MAGTTTSTTASGAARSCETAQPTRGGLDAYLGAARVTRVSAESMVVALEDEATLRGTVVHATNALTFPYQCVVGDQVLVVGDEAAFYVIGVLRGRGHTTLSAPRGGSIRAESGRLHLVGERGIRLSGGRIHLEAARLRRLATTAVMVFGERVARIRELHRVEAGQLDERSEGRWLLQTHRAVLKVLEKARIKGPTVRVG